MEFLIVTGLSGSGKSGTINVLEDMGFYCIDNIPPQLIPKFADICCQSPEQMKRVAIVTDIRGIVTDPETGGFFDDPEKSLEELRRQVKKLSVLFLDATDETLIKRYKETRRRHPLDERSHGSLETAVTLERKLLSHMREAADHYIDTSDMSISQLKDTLIDLFLDDPRELMGVKVMSFGFKYGMCREADLVFDVRCLPNPFYIPELKTHTGKEACVSDYVMSFEQSRELEKKLRDMIDFLLPLYRKEGKTQLVIAFGCTGGKHRSVTFAEAVCKYLSEQGIRVRVSHRDIDRHK